MRQVTILVSKCCECPHAGFDGDENFCVEASSRYGAYLDNQDGITPSCPMHSNSVEVEG